MCCANIFLSLDWNHKGTGRNLKLEHELSEMPCHSPAIAGVWSNGVIGNDEEQAGLIWDEEPQSHWTVIVLRDHNKGCSVSTPGL